MSDLFSVRDVIWQAATESEQEILHKRWQSEQGKPKEEKMNVATNNWLEDKVAAQVRKFVDEREQKALEARRAKRENEERLESELRKHLADFIKETGGYFGNGKANFKYRERTYGVFLQDGFFWLWDGSGSEKLDNAIPGTVTDRVIHLLAKREDF
jgi:hypothetical protein